MWGLLLLMLLPVQAEATVTVSTLAGSGTQGFADVPGVGAKFSNPNGVAVNSTGTVYVADASNQRIRKILPNGTVSTLAGSTQGFVDGAGTAAKFNNPSGVAADSAGTVYVADYTNNRIRKVLPDGTVSTLAGSTQGFSDGAGSSAKFFRPAGVAVDSAGTVYVADTNNHRIRKVLSNGTVSTLAGSGVAGFADGVGAAAQFSSPNGVIVNSAGTVYVADTFNHRIRKILPDGTVSTLAGSGTAGFADGAGATAKFKYPEGVAVDSAGTVYVADTQNHRIRKILPDGTVSTLAGSGTVGFADGPGAIARFWSPMGVAVDSAGTVYVGDQGNHRIRKILPDGTVSTLAGSGTAGFADGPGAIARFWSPMGVAVDSAGTVYVADTNNNRIRKILPDGTVSTLAGSGTAGIADGAGATAQFDNPKGVAADSAGTVYVADYFNHRIRKITIQSHPNDFDGDGQGDILWRHATTGQNALWYLNGTALGAGSALFSPVADGNWKIAGVGDFDQDGKSDILWRHATTGQNAIWLMNGTTVTAGTAMIATVPDLNWKVAAVSDYNKDGKCDILWRHATTGQNAIWFMNGATVLPGSAYIPSATDLNWQIQQ